MAKAILNIKSNPAMSATLRELGWLPIDHNLNRYRIRYYHRIRYNLSETRLCKQVFNDLYADYIDDKPVVWPYCSEIHKILKNVGLDGAFKSQSEHWLDPYMRLSVSSYKISFFPGHR